MSDSAPETTSITWVDLTVDNAGEVSDFYSKVVGWKADAVDMGGYSDFNMNAPESGMCVAGICHARGTNAALPPQWLIYVNVTDLDQSIVRCAELGGEILVGPRDMGSQGRYCVIRDPAGAAIALFEPAG